LLGCYLFLIYCRKLTWYKKFLYRYRYVPFIKNVPFPYTTLFVVHVFSKIVLKQPLTPKGE
jgi:hypothetical protein